MNRITVLAALFAAVHMATAGPIGYSVRSNVDDHLYQIDLATGAATDLGELDFGDAEGISFGTDGELYAIGGFDEEFWKITTPPGSMVGWTGPRDGVDAGLGLDPTTGKLYNLNGGFDGSSLYTVNQATGATTLVGSSQNYGDNLAIDASGSAFAIDAIFADSLFSVNLSTGALTLIGGLGIGDVSVQVGSSFDSSGVLWMLDSEGAIRTVNTVTGLATLVAHVNVAGTILVGWEGLAIQTGAVPTIPEPGTFALLGLGLVALRRRRK